MALPFAKLTPDEDTYLIHHGYTVGFAGTPKIIPLAIAVRQEHNKGC
jgi:acyl-CoA hydrolase